MHVNNEVGETGSGQRMVCHNVVREIGSGHKSEMTSTWHATSTRIMRGLSVLREALIFGGSEWRALRVHIATTGTAYLRVLTFQNPSNPPFSLMSLSHTCPSNTIATTLLIYRQIGKPPPLSLSLSLYPLICDVHPIIPIG